MAQTIEWRQNVTKDPKVILNVDWHNLYCRCGGILNYVYACMWRCRQCDRWHSYTPKAGL